MPDFNETPKPNWRESRWFKALSMLVKLGIAAAILAVLIWKADIKWENFANLPKGWIVGALALLLLQMLLTGVRWYALTRAVALKVPLHTAVSLTMQGVFFTLFIPGGSVSGDIIKAGLIAQSTAKGSKFYAVFSIVMDRVCGLCGLLLLAWLTVIYALFHVAAPSPILHTILWNILWIAPLALVAAVCAFRCDLLLKIKLFKVIYDFLNRITKGAIGEIEAALAAYRPAWKTVLLWSLLSGLIMFSLIALAVWLIAIAVLGQEAALAMLAPSFLSGSIGELAGTLPLTPGGIGVRDVVFMEIFKAYGFGESESTLVPVIFTTLFIVASATGALFTLWSLIASMRGKREK